MNQEPNNIENTQTNLENTQTVTENTQTNVEIAPVVEQTNTELLENTQTAVQMTPVSEATEELELPASTPSESTEALQPTIAPTVTTTPVQEDKVQIEEGPANVDVGTQPHDVPIPDEKSKKDFVIKSKKETVAEDVKAREIKIAEHIKKANENYKPNSKFRNILLILFFIIIIAFTIFLPEIHNLVAKWQAGELNPQEEVKITTGVLTCTYNKSSDNLDYTYEVLFNFKDNKLESYEVDTTTKGDVSLDKEKLDVLKNNCNIMRAESESIDGITVSCKSESNSILVVEAVEIKDFKENTITSAYTEAGGSYPKFTYQQNMDTLEKNMVADRYTCERSAS